jgi:hypothetical protein
LKLHAEDGRPRFSASRKKNPYRARLASKALDARLQVKRN